MNKDYKNLVKETYIEPYTGYILNVTCDANDGDYISEEIRTEDIYKDELFFLVLCYLNTDKAWGLWGDDCRFGEYVEDDEYFDWLWDYCRSNDLLLFAGMCDCSCHSVCGVDIKHYRQGLEYTVNLPSIDKIFESPEEMKTYMTDLYEKL